MPARFRQFLFDHDSPRLSGIRGIDPYAYREAAKQDPFTGGLIQGWAPLQLAEFRGITADGALRPEVHTFSPAEPGEEAPVAAMIWAAQALEDELDEAALAALRRPSMPSSGRRGRIRSSCSSTPASASSCSPDRSARPRWRSSRRP